ncbi:MAG: 2-isopropylmalate synthase, partial [Spirochaetota bacterium]
MKKEKYAKMPEIDVSQRNWPTQQITVSPAWCAVDLRDGNQALPNPMTPDQKLEYFNMLVAIGFKEIEIGFPSASEDDFSFCRRLIEEKHIPDDVMISVLTQSRPHLISRTLEALKGVKQAVVHVYIATSELHMKYVFGMDEEQVCDTARAAVKQIKSEAAALAGSVIGLEFSPEEFTDTDLGFAVQICEAVVEAWDPAEGEKVIINLPMTVERRMPNQYADMIEEFNRLFRFGDKAVISLHAHNDMGCAVAATMLALMAGAARVEGTLLGHGERTGNVDLITIALNLHYMGIDTGLDFSKLPEIVSVVERVSGIP